MPLTGKYVELEHIIEKIFRDNGYTNEVDKWDCMEWAGEALMLIGQPNQYVEKVVNITVADYKAFIPCDVYEIITVREGENKYPMRKTTDTFHYDHTTGIYADSNINSDITYGLNDNYIWSSFKEGSVDVAYRAFPTNDDGGVLIPDDIKYIKAVQHYLTMKIDYRLWRQGKLNGDVYAKSEQEWLWYVGAAQMKALMPDRDQMEALKNQWCRWISRPMAHDGNFKNLGTREMIWNKR